MTDCRRTSRRRCQMADGKFGSSQIRLRKRRFGRGDFARPRPAWPCSSSRSLRDERLQGLGTVGGLRDPLLTRHHGHARNENGRKGPACRAQADVSGAARTAGLPAGKYPDDEIAADENRCSGSPDDGVVGLAATVMKLEPRAADKAQGTS